MKPISLVLAVFLLPVSSVSAQEVIHWDVVQKIMDEGFNNSHIMEDASYLTDVYGPRLPRSPSYIASAKWAAQKFEEYGLENVRLEPYEFGVGWRNDFTSVHMMTPQYMPIIAYPQSWSSPTNGNVRGPAVHINFEKITSEEDLGEYKGKLKDAVIFSAPKRLLTPSFEPEAVLLSKEQLDEMARIKISPPASDRNERNRETDEFPRRKILDFVFSEGAAAVVSPCQVYDDGTVMVTKVAGRPWEKDAPKAPTELVMAAEHYNRIMRILEKGMEVEMEVEIRVSLFDDDLTDYNVIAEIPGSDLAHEVVMLGAHLDAHGAATGTEDNATGVAQVLEAARILKAIGAKPRRTIQFALWGGEETGLMGSKAYVAKHFVDPKTKEYTSEHDNFSCYFNLDYGCGEIRGVYLMNNLLAQPILSEWMKPFHNLGMEHLILIPGQGIGSDHEKFRAVGLPIFPLLQDPVENDTRTFHSNMDFYDKIVPKYLIQGTVICAGFVYHASMSDTKMPRIPGDQ